MKKIIELAERICNQNWVIRNEFIEQMRKELAERHQLEQTPITEEWLREHGWRQCGQYGHQFVHPKCSFWLFGSSDFTCWEITKTEYVVDYGDIDCEFCEITTVAQLLDALELCNIKID